ncbi:MAG TPA: hypothetical protein VJT08_11170 [Terriglobales bacterium]|nr:hypothetical protein [Terriglobales bacterium]
MERTKVDGKSGFHVCRIEVSGYDAVHFQFVTQVPRARRKSSLIASFYIRRQIG